uniref:Uncharacterized protein n=1 Tax=Tetraselmis sp. GSL018 TaxID=582737 RepID=A0A061RXJ8_9CHLO
MAVPGASSGFRQGCQARRPAQVRTRSGDLVVDPQRAHHPLAKRPQAFLQGHLAAGVVGGQLHGAVLAFVAVQLREALLVLGHLHHMRGDVSWR